MFNPKWMVGLISRLVAIFSVDKVIPLKSEKTLVLEGESVGEIAVGMLYRIPLNNSLGMTVPISRVVKLSDTKIQLQTYFDDEEDYEFVFSFNIGQEIFEIYNSEE